METITIACPIHNRGKYLPFYLKCILNQTYPKNQTDLFFVTNNCTDDSIKILMKFKQAHSDKYSNIRLDNINDKSIPSDGEDRYSRSRTTVIYDFLSYLRNYICRNTNTDYLFSVDSDIMLLPDTLERLLIHNKKCISALVCNGHVFANNYKEKNIDKYQYTNILNMNERGRYSHINLTGIQGLVEVDVTGAVYLLHKDIYKKCKYRKDLQGEDIPFCKNIKKLNYKLYCDTSIKLAHCMTLELLENYKKGKFTY